MIALPARSLIRYRGWVIAAWAALALLFAPKATHVQRVLAVRGTAIHETESARATELIKAAFPNPIAEYVAIVVRGPVSYRHPRFRAVLDSLSAVLRRQPYVTQVISVRTIGESTFVSRDLRTTFLIAALSPSSSNDELSRTVVPALRGIVRETLGRLPLSGGFDVKITGNPALDHDVRTISTEDTRRSERRAVPLTLVVLVLAFGALVAASLPIIVGVLAITIALGIVAVAAQFQTMSVFVLNITTMVGLGVGIDYSLLIVTRFREELNRGLSPTDAAIRTIHTAGSAVVTSGLTVVVGFGALILTPLTETRSVGVGGLIVVAVAVLLATTFLPAALAILGRNIDRPKWLARPLAHIHAPTGWERWARSLGHRPWRAILGGGLAVAVLTYPLTQIRIGLPATNWFPPQAESGQGLAALREMGAGGVIQPLRVVVQLPEGQSVLTGRRLPGLKALSDSMRRDPRVREVRGVATLRPGMSSLQLAMFYSDAQSVRDRYPEFFDAYLSADRRTTLLDVIATDTVSLTGMMDLTRRLRAVIAGELRGLQDADVLVGGFAASSVDLQDDLLGRFPGIVAMILGVTALMLFIAFRSLLVPLKAVVLNCISVGAAFGLTVFVFQHGYGGALFGLEGPTQAIFVVVPVLVFATVFGLSMDYEVFLLTRVKEVFDKTGRNDHATMEGLSATASTITFAALIMIIVFGSFAFTRVLAVQFIGFGLAVAVLLDATLIRMVLVPAIMHIAGRWNWWPGVRAPKHETTADPPPAELT
ncbi:MAG: MMPL family transporter [Gemmatimonadales bacterium]|nr:MMPL family transporter [Gemmatimonadales bacterium]